MATSRRAGTGFINLSDWAAANEYGSQRLADELAGGVERGGREAQNYLDNLQRDFNERLTDGTLQYDTRDLDSRRAAYLGNEGYTGPDTLADSSLYNAAMSRAQEAGRNAGLLNDYFGRTTLLDDKYGSDGNYSTGQRLLDSALVGGTAGNRFAQLENQWGGLFDRAQGMERDASNAAAEARRTSEDAARRYAEAAPGLRRQEEQARVQAQRDFMRERYEQEREERERRAERDRRNRDANRDLNRREGLTPGSKGPRDRFAWDF